MAIIIRDYSEVDGQIGEASSINNVIDDIYTLQAGNLNSANLAISAVGTTNLENSAVTTNKIDQVDVTLFAQVFS